MSNQTINLDGSYIRSPWGKYASTSSRESNMLYKFRNSQKTINSLNDIMRIF